MRFNLVGAFIRNAPFGTEIAFKKGLDGLSYVGVSTNAIDSSFDNQKWDYDADVTIVFKWMEGYWEDLRKCKGKKIVYQPDDIRFPHIEKMMYDMREYCDYAFTFDDTGAELAKKIGYKNASRLLLTADPDLYRRLNCKKDIDFCFIGSLTNGHNHISRLKMVNMLRASGFNVHSYSDIYDIKLLNELYNRSYVVLNHATDVGQKFGTGYGYQCRHFEAGFAGACLLSNEVLSDKGDLTNFVRFHDEQSLLLACKFLKENKQITYAIGDALFDELYEKHTPYHRAAEILHLVESFK